VQLYRVGLLGIASLFKGTMGQHDEQIATAASGIV
jgi:hypothetical protein